MTGRMPLVLILIFMFSFGLINVFTTARLSAPQPWGAIEQLSIVSLPYWWYYADKTRIEYRSGSLLNISVIALPLVAIPIYLFRSRGAKQGLKSFALFFIFVCAMVTALVIGGTVAQKIAP